MNTLVFVYGTLKRGCSNHGQIAGEKFVGLGRTVPGYRLYDLGGFPAIAPQSEDTNGVVGEVWSVGEQRLRDLDRFEGVHEGLYRRQPIPLQPPFADQPIDAYIPVLPVTGRAEVGSEWIE